jgi:hypothetical protein
MKYKYLTEYALAQLVEALGCKQDGHEFDFRWGHLKFSLTSSFGPHYGSGVDSASNINEYQGSSLEGIKAAGA